MSKKRGTHGPVYNHRDAPGPQKLVRGEPARIEAITDHIEKHVGPVAQVFHEQLSPIVHVDVHHVAPSPRRPFHTLVTSGMSERPMTVPKGAELCRRAELFLLLRPEWQVSMEAFKDENNYWPMRLLKDLARLPHEHQTWLGPGHTVTNGMPPEPYAPSAAYCGALLTNPLSLGADFETLQTAGGERINFWQVLPLYAEEMDLKVKHGADALLDLLNRYRVPDIIAPHRRNACHDPARIVH